MFTLPSPIGLDLRAAALLGGSGAAAGPVTLTLQSGTDNTLYNGNPTQNLGTETIVRIGDASNGNQTYRALLKFDLSGIPATATVLSAILSLRATGDQSLNVRTYRVYRTKRTWVESESSWNNYFTANAWQTAGGFGANDCEQTEIGSRSFGDAETLNEWKDFTLTAGAGGVQDMIPGGVFTNNGFFIKADTEFNDSYYFESFDSVSAANRPKLVIVYQP